MVNPQCANVSFFQQRFVQLLKVLAMFSYFKLFNFFLH